MSGDSHSDKNIEKTGKSDRAESRLDTPDANEAREADKSTISEIGKQNPDNWMSAEGHFAIVDEGQVLASRDVDPENSAPTSIKEAFNKSDQPVGGYEQENRADGGITLKGVIPGEIEVNKAEAHESSDESNPLNQIGEILLTGTQKYLEEQKERTLGATIGTVQGIGELTMDFVNIAEFVGDVIVGNKERAAEKGAKFGESLGKTLVGGVNVFKAAHKYLFDIGFEGDYAKPFRDIHSLGMALDREWTKLPPVEQERLKYKLATDVIAGAIPLGSATKITRAQKLTTALEEAAVLGNELKHGEKASHSIKEVLQDFLSKKRKAKTADELGSKNDNTILADVVADIEQRRAGAGGDWPTINERFSESVVRQSNDLSCTSAVGEMLSEGKVTQSSLMERIGFPADLEDLATVLTNDLNQPWKSLTASKKGLETLLKRGKPFGANLKDLPTGRLYEKVKLPHTVFVEGLDETGNLLIKDPWRQTTYGMTFDDFYDHWTNWTIFQE